MNHRVVKNKKKGPVHTGPFGVLQFVPSDPEDDSLQLRNSSNIQIHLNRFD
jgi:hypothetical protein